MTCSSRSGGVASPLPADWPQQRLYFLPLPHGQGAFLDGVLWAPLAGMAIPVVYCGWQLSHDGNAYTGMGVHIIMPLCRLSCLARVTAVNR